MITDLLILQPVDYEPSFLKRIEQEAHNPWTKNPLKIERGDDVSLGADFVQRDENSNHAEVYQLLGDIKLEFDDSHASYIEETYSRVLDLDTATTKVKYSVGEVEFVREHFASNPDQVIVTKISGSKSKVSLLYGISRQQTTSSFECKW
ncbi:Alpha-L-fucosidase 2 [Camellia lanceoleosa]|nr:Alpha-L-fucosidase 2 [Camellia lanceoleosa]